MVGETASFGNLIDFETVDISRKQKFLRRIDTGGVEELQRRDAFFFDELTSDVVFGQIEFVVDGIDIKIRVGEVLDNSVGNNLDMVALLHRAVELRYKAEYKVGKRHYYVGRTTLRSGEVTETHIHCRVQISLLVVLDYDCVLKRRRPTRYRHMYISESAVGSVAVQSIWGNYHHFVLRVFERS